MNLALLLLMIGTGHTAIQDRIEVITWDHGAPIINGERLKTTDYVRVQRAFDSIVCCDGSVAVEDGEPRGRQPIKVTWYEGPK